MEINRILRKKGLTIQRSNDCLIAFYAIESTVPLVHTDSDFESIRKHSRLKTWKSRA